MDIGTTFIADMQPAETVESAERAFDHPAPFAKALARFDAVAGNARCNASAT